MKNPVVIINRCQLDETPKKKQKSKKKMPIQFGSDFRRGISNTHCAIGYLLTNDIFSSVKGTIDTNKTNSIKKSYLWSYIVYLLHWNRTVPPFSNVVYSKTASEAQLVQLVSSVIGNQEKAFNKSQLVQFINTITDTNVLNIPVLNRLIPSLPNTSQPSTPQPTAPQLSVLKSWTNTNTPPPKLQSEKYAQVNVYGRQPVYNQQDGRLSIDLDVLVSPTS